MDYMSNTFASDQDSIRMTDFFKIANSILRRELSQEEKDKLLETHPGSIEEVKHILGIKPSTLIFIIKAVKKGPK